MIIDAASQHRHRIETPDAVGCIASTATMRCDDDVGSPAELLANKVNLSDREFKDFWNSLPDHINNPCATGFIIEQAILSRISFSGLNIAGKDINTSMSVVIFSDNFPKFRTDIMGQPTLYCPQMFNFRCIGGMIIRIGPQPMTKENRQQLFMYPLQI